MSKKIFVIIGLLSLLLLSSMATCVSAAAPIRAVGIYNVAVADWTEGEVTIHADFSSSSAMIAGEGAPVSHEDLYVSVKHSSEEFPINGEVQSFDLSWSGNHASASALISFNMGGTIYYHEITITWIANSKPTASHYTSEVGGVMVGLAKAAVATLTVSTPDNAQLSLIHAGTFTTDEAAFGRFTLSVGLLFPQ